MNSPKDFNPLQTIAGTGGSTNKCKHCGGLGQVQSSHRTSDRQNSINTAERLQDNSDRAYTKLGSERLKLLNSSKKTSLEPAAEKSDSFRKVFSQIQKLTEDNKKIS
jgi:hypothetical protein